MKFWGTSVHVFINILSSLFCKSCHFASLTYVWFWYITKCWCRTVFINTKWIDTAVYKYHWRNRAFFQYPLSRLVSQLLSGGTIIQVSSPYIDFISSYSFSKLFLGNYSFQDEVKDQMMLSKLYRIRYQHVFKIFLFWPKPRFLLSSNFRIFFFIICSKVHQSLYLGLEFRSFWHFSTNWIIWIKKTYWMA